MCAPSAPLRAATSIVGERDARQLSQEEKAARATFAVRNDGTVEELEQQLSEVLGNLRTMIARRRRRLAAASRTA